MERLHIRSLVHKHVKMHAAQRVIEMYIMGEPYAQFIADLSPEVQIEVEGLLRAVAESWSNAIHPPPIPQKTPSVFLR